MSKHDLAVEPGADEKVEKDLQPATENVDTVATQVQTIFDAQTEAKWGTERGPSAFRTAYVKVLSDAQDEIAALKRELDAYITTVKAVVEEFTEKDSDSATAQKILDGRADHQADEAAGDTPPASPPSSTAPRPQFQGSPFLNNSLLDYPHADSQNKVCTAPALPPTADSLTDPNS